MQEEQEVKVLVGISREGKVRIKTRIQDPVLAADVLLHGVSAIMKVIVGKKNGGESGKERGREK